MTRKKKQCTVPGIDAKRLEQLVTIQTLIADLPADKLTYIAGVAYGMATANRIQQTTHNAS